MNRNDFGLVKNFTSGGAINPRRVVKFDAVDGQVIQGAAATDKVVGVTGILGAVAVGERIDILLDGVRELEAGGVFGQGDDLVSDAQGRVVAAAPGAGVLVHSIGQALGSSTAAGQIVPVKIGKFAIKG